MTSKPCTSQTIYYEIIECFPFAAALVESGYIKRVNDKFSSIFNESKKRRSLINQTIQSILPEMPPEIIDRLKAGVKKGEEFSCRLWAIKAGMPLLIESIFKAIDYNCLLWIVKDY